MMISLSKLSRIAATVALATLLGCPRRSAIWIIGQEAPGRPVFGIGETVRGRPTWLGYLVVATCDRWDGTLRSAIWGLEQQGSSVPVDRVYYGRSATGYVVPDILRGDVSAGVPPLKPGCYIASISGTGRVRFNVAADGSVLEERDPELPSSAA